MSIGNNLKMVKKCPVCGSTRYNDSGEVKYCKKCGYTNKDKVRGKVICGPMDQNWWMR